jgi:transcriptional regulator with XRE-family HTH domain
MNFRRHGSALDRDLAELAAEPSCITPPIDAASARRPRELIQRKYRSLDRFYLETDFSKGHLSNILRSNGSPTVTTLAKLAKALDVEVKDFFIFPERSPRDRAIGLVQTAKPDVVRRVIRLLTDDSGNLE